jgi:hypothetical protein
MQAVLDTPLIIGEISIFVLHAVNSDFPDSLERMWIDEKHAV